jgi:hypothetical protein
VDGWIPSERVATRVGLLGVDEIEADFPFSYSLSLPSGPAQSCLAFIIFIYLFIYLFSWAIGLFLVLAAKKFRVSLDVDIGDPRIELGLILN